MTAAVASQVSALDVTSQQRPHTDHTHDSSSSQQQQQHTTAAHSIERNRKRPCAASAAPAPALPRPTCALRSSSSRIMPLMRGARLLLISAGSSGHISREHRPRMQVCGGGAERRNKLRARITTGVDEHDNVSMRECFGGILIAGKTSAHTSSTIGCGLRPYRA